MWGLGAPVAQFHVKLRLPLRLHPNSIMTKGHHLKKEIMTSSYINGCTLVIKFNILLYEKENVY